MKKFFAVILGLLTFAQIQFVAAAPPKIIYQAYVEGLGWQADVGNGGIAGTFGQSKRMEAVVIKLSSKEGSVQYRAHVQNIGWQAWKTSGEVAGTVGQNLRMEAISISLTGSYANKYDIYYRTHVENGGWLGWARNGEPAGTAGASLRMEALQIQIVPKGTSFNREGSAFYQRIKIDSGAVI